MTRWQHGFAASEGERIYWERAGHGTPLVICHGAGSNHVTFYQQVAGLADESVRVIVWDQRGYGNSTFSNGIWSVGVGAKDLSAVLDAAEQTDAAIHVVGQALGALIAARWAIDNPTRVLSLALWDGPFGIDEDGHHLAWQMEPNDADVQAALVNRQVGFTRAVGADYTAHNPAGTFLYQTLQELGNARPSHAQVFTAAQAEPISLTALAALRVPILLGRGEYDPFADATKYAELVARLPNAVTVMLPDCGHSPYFEVPDAWNAAMRAHTVTARSQSNGHTVDLT